MYLGRAEALCPTRYESFGPFADVVGYCDESYKVDIYFRKTDSETLCS